MTICSQQPANMQVTLTPTSHAHSSPTPKNTYSPVSVSRKRAAGDRHQGFEKKLRAYSIMPEEFRDDRLRTLLNENGDVLVQLYLEDAVIHLHLRSSILKRSGWFAQQLETDSATSNGNTVCPESALARRALAFYFALEARKADGNLPMLRPVDASETNELILAERKFSQVGDEQYSLVKMEDTEMGNADEKTGLPLNSKGSSHTERHIIQAYQSLFLCLYGSNPMLSRINTSLALLQSEILIRLGQMYDCFDSVTLRINTVLVDFRQSLFFGIADDPARWLLLSLDLKSGLIFSEALTHICGAHPAWPWKTAKTKLPDSIAKFVQERSAALASNCISADRGLLVNTITLTTSNDPSKSPPDNPVMSSDAVGNWFVVQIYRHYIAGELYKLDRMGHARRALARGEFYRRIRRAGDAYLPLEQVFAELDTLEGSALAAKDEVAEDLRLLKSHARQIVKEIAKNELMLDVEQARIGYLTCVEVRADDYPWDR